MLKVEGLSKRYPAFELKDISIELPAGYITGFIGRNGAGKSTTIKCILDLVRADSGRIEILGKTNNKSSDIKQDVGFLLGEFNAYPNKQIKKLVNIYKIFFENWNQSIFDKYVEKFKLDINKKVKELSSGMKVKLGIALALSHNAKLLIFDEPTSGLDPISRQELTEIFREVVNEGDKSILFSTHITSDLDKCADYIIFIKDGRIVLNMSKDDMIDTHILVAGGKEDLSDAVMKKLIGYRVNAFGFNGLMLSKDYDDKDGLVKERPNLEDIMVYYNADEEEIR